MPSKTKPAGEKSQSHIKLELEGSVYVFGYYAKKVTDNSCLVTVISQFSSGLHRLEIDFSFCRKLKLFIEELTNFTDGVSAVEPKTIIDSVNVGEKIASYLGSATSFLRKRPTRPVGQMEDINHLINLPPAESSLALDVSKAAGIPSLQQTSQECESLHGSIEEFAREPYHERNLGPKDSTCVEIPFVRQMFPGKVLFKWEYSCRSEQSPSFGIYYLPNDKKKLSPTANLLSLEEENLRVLLPLSQIMCYTKPALGTISLSDLKSGTIILRWSNSQPISARFSKQLLYKTIFQGDSESLPDLHAQIAIPRKSFYSQPIIIDSSILKDGLILSVEYSTGNVIVPFALYFDKLSDQVGEVSVVADRLASVIQGDNTRNIGAIPRKTLIGLNHHSKAGQSTHAISITSPGIYTLVWDNSASIVSTRQVSVRIRMKECPSIQKIESNRVTQN
jgi:hypothetical protein